MPVSCPRDANGWRIPQMGTTAWEIYILHHLGLSGGDIAAALEITRTHVSVVLWGCRHPKNYNAAKLSHYHRHTAPKRRAAYV